MPGQSVEKSPSAVQKQTIINGNRDVGRSFLQELQPDEPENVFLFVPNLIGNSHVLIYLGID